MNVPLRLPLENHRDVGLGNELRCLIRKVIVLSPRIPTQIKATAWMKDQTMRE
jgi:hypothetical protein